MKNKILLILFKAFFILAMPFHMFLNASEASLTKASSLADRKAALKRRQVSKNGNQTAAAKKSSYPTASQEMEDLEALGWKVRPSHFLHQVEPEKESILSASDTSTHEIEKAFNDETLVRELPSTLSVAEQNVLIAQEEPAEPGRVPSNIAEPANPNTPAETQNQAGVSQEGTVKGEDQAQRRGQEIAMPEEPPRTISINFNNVSAVEYLRFVSRIANKNFVFDESDLDFSVTVVSEEETTIEDVMAALIQVLRVHDLAILEEGDTIVVHRNLAVNSISNVGSDGNVPTTTEMVTQVFHLNTLDPLKASTVIKPLTSAKSQVEALEGTNNLIVTDIFGNVKLIDKLLKSLDSPKAGLVVGQYVVRNGVLDSLLSLAQQIMYPIAQDQPLVFVPHASASSIFIVSTPFLVEKSISILQRLDQTQGTTRIFDLDELNLRGRAAGTAEGTGGPGIAGTGQGLGKWDLDSQGNWIFRPSLPAGAEGTPQGRWYKDANGNWYFVPEGVQSPFTGQEALERSPKGVWEKDANGNWVFRLSSGESISAEPITRTVPTVPNLPLGHIERTKFFIHKLQYRRGDDIERALSRIGESLYQLGQGNEDLIATINTVQWLEASNSLIFTGTTDAIRKLEELIAEVDTPLRQVFIEMLILETTLDDSLNIGVNWGTRFGGGNTAGSQAFLTAASPLPVALDTTGIINGRILTPSAINLARTPGFNGGIVGQSVNVGNLTFQSFGLLIKALHDKTNTNIVMNPKILTEDNVTAEIFVGINTPFRTQSISNDQGSIITSNVEFRNVGTTLKITPFLGNNDIVTLEIREEVSSVGAGSAVTDVLSTSNPGPTTNLSRTTTRVHVPDGYFLVISGMMQDEQTRRRVTIPCLGGLPIIGAAFSDKDVRDQKRNLMIFIRPEIIDTEEEIQNLTKHQQDIFRYKNETKRSWKYEVDEGLDFFNLRSTEKYEACESCEADVKYCK